MRLERLAACGGKQDLVKLQPVGRGERDVEVAEMRRVKRASEEGDTHRGDCKWTSLGCHKRLGWGGG